MDAFFDSTKKALEKRHNGGQTLTLQWDFRDTEPWFMRLSDGDSEVARGRLEDPDIRFTCRFEDWVDVSMGREDPRKALVTGRVLPRGRLRKLWQARPLFAP
jgi:hypothetical protein